MKGCRMTKNKKMRCRESTKRLSNVRRGWYRIFPVTVGEVWDPVQAETSLAAEDTLVLLEILIPGEDINEQEVQGLRDVFSFFIQRKQDLILRFSYDYEGKGMEKDPSALSVVERHISQILPVVNAYAEHTFILQGVFLGSWGEMHSSRFLTKENIQKLEKQYKGELSPQIYRSVRKPVHWRMICADEQEMEQEKIGLYNDGMFGSETDFGTFADAGGEREYVWEESWPAEWEQDLIQKNARWAPNGGEVVGGLNQTAEEILRRLRKEGITYLNRDYDLNELERWRKLECGQGGVWQGTSLYDYVEAHMGYRFVVRKAEIRRRFSHSVLILEIENAGFAVPYEEVFLELWKDTQTPPRCVWKQPMQQIEPGKTVVWKKTWKENLLEEGWKLRLRDARGNRISFANEGAEKEISLSMFH